MSPIYVFRCKDCGFVTEEHFKMNDEHTAWCPICKKVIYSKDYKSMVPAIHDVPVDSVDMDITGKPMRFHTKGQLKRMAKEHGCDVA